MEIEVQLDGIDATEQTTFALENWLRQERIAGLRVEPKRVAPKPGEMGAELIPILSCVLAAPAVVVLVRSLHVWIQTRKPKVSLKVKTETVEVTIDAENVGDQESFVRRVLSSLNLASA